MTARAISRLLIANRGEIARRVIRTARRMGIETVAVYSDADARAPFVAEADQALRLGRAPARESYLDGARLIMAAQASGADAVHPGYGFLSENPVFAEAVTTAGLVWVGAPPAAMRAMGLKDAAKALMHAAGVPVTPGYQGPDQSPERLRVEADGLGYPVLIKAVAGGGGKGMRRVDRDDAFAEGLASCRREAVASFGDDRVLIETYVARPRHLEVQVFGDAHGEVVHLFERDCSLQRRHQKVIEEAPAPGIDDATRAAICAAAVRAARAVDYQGAGTIEFIADASAGLRADRIWFMEMNTRLQVEHPVTEAVTGLDLVEWQLRVAAGEPLPLRQHQITLTGCAMEARLYAETPSTGFLPSTGLLTHLKWPQGVRIDAAVEEGGEVGAHYDPMIAKLIAHAATREAAAAALARACAEVEVWPLKTNAGFLARTLREADFVAGWVDTGFIAARQEALAATPPPPPAVLQAAAHARLAAEPGDRAWPWRAMTGWRLNAAATTRIGLHSAEGEVEVALESRAPGRRLGTFDADGAIVVFHAGEAYAFADPSTESGGAAAASDGAVRAPMPGRVAAIHAKNGDALEPGAPLLTLEAMKMEHRLLAPFAGIVADLAATVGDQIVEGAVLARLERQP